MKIHDFVKSLRQSGEVDLDGSLLRSIAPDPSGGSRATGQHKIRSVDSVSKIDVETVNVEIGGTGTKEGITVIVTFTDGDAWKFETNTPRPQSVVVRRFVAEITHCASAT